MITPYNLINMRFFFNNVNFLNKIYLKQSYIYLIWIYYLHNFQNNHNNNIKIKLIFLPQKKKLFSNIKSTIAHKTNAKEQFFLKYYKFKYIIIYNSTRDYNFNQILLFLLIIKNKFPFFETNLFFIKNYSYFLIFFNNFFLNFFFFNKIK